jgi:hypothetical protein
MPIACERWHLSKHPGSYFVASRTNVLTPEAVVSRVIRGPVIHDYGPATVVHWEALRSLGIFARLCVREN